MTLAIGAYFVGGMIVCADTNVVFTDDNVITGEKLRALELGDRTYVIANAAYDGRAGTMLATEILERLSDSTERFKIEPIIKKVMTAWYSKYLQFQPPELSFILAARAGLQNKRIFLCQPPNTVTLMESPIAVGGGSRVVDPLLPNVLAGKVNLRPTIVRIAYLMYRAKKDHIKLANSQTDLMVVCNSGEVRPVSRHSMKAAEALGPEIDFLLMECCLGMLSQGAAADHQNFTETFNRAYLKLADKVALLKFPSLNGL
jgi:hypothetical protein